MPRHDYFTISSPGAPPQPVICGTMQVGITRLMMAVMILVIVIRERFKSFKINSHKKIGSFHGSCKNSARVVGETTK